MSRINRRKALKYAGSAGLALGAANILPGNLKAQNGQKPRFFVVVTGWGGASMIDGFMAFSRTEVETALKAKGKSAAEAKAQADSQVCFEDQNLALVEGTPFRAPKLQGYKSAAGTLNLDPFAPFAKEFAQDMLVMTYQASSVTHAIAQKRSVTGNEAWDGRTLQELAAMQYGGNMAVPNLAMGGGGFVIPGIDPTIPGRVAPAVPTNPLTWPLSLDGYRGLQNVPAKNLVELARAKRQILDSQSSFANSLSSHPRLQRWLAQRDINVPKLEADDTVSKLMFWDKVTAMGPASGITVNETQNQTLFDLFPYWNSGDSLHTQAVLGLKALTSGTSCSITLGLSRSEETVTLEDGTEQTVNLGIGFDASHGDHPGGQFFGWNRILDTITKIIRYLKATPFDSQESYWDRTVLYFAQDFGREKIRPTNATSWGSGHHVNNAALIISPFVQGNKVLGGVDVTTGLTYGTDTSGKADPTKAPHSEKELFAGIAQVLGVDDTEIKTKDSSWPDMRAKLLKSGKS
jgi:hypothetical protein